MTTPSPSTTNSEHTPVLSVLISTIGERITSVPDMLLPPDPRVCYLVMWQEHDVRTEAVEKALLLLERGDVSLYYTPEKGLAKSRQASFQTCTTPLMLITDDDVQFRPDAFTKIIRAFDRHKDADVLCFRAEDRDGNPLQKYPEQATDYENRPRGYSAASVEIALRKRYNLPRFDPRFGLGSPELVCGEEDVFLHDCMKRGLCVRFVPETICATNGDTTSVRMERHPKFIKTKGAALRRIHGRTGAWLRSVKYALQAPWGEKMWRFRLLAQGIRYIERTPLPIPLISVIMPCFNRAATLPRLFDSLLAVDYDRLQIILVDNASTDDTLKQLETFRAKYANRFDSVSVLFEPTRNAATARNRGLNVAIGEYVYFFDSDDELSPNFFKDALPFMGQYDLICARTRMVFENGKTRTRWRKRPTTPAAHILGGVISTQTCLVRRNFITKRRDEIGWEYYISWHQGLTRWDDLEWGLRMLLADPSVKWLNGVYHRIYRHADSISGPSLERDREAVFTALKGLFDALICFDNVLPPQEIQKAWNALLGRLIFTLHKMFYGKGEGKLTTNALYIVLLKIYCGRAVKQLTERENKIARYICIKATKAYKSRSLIVYKMYPKWLPGLWRVLLTFV
ncbi:MAG: glycosyltransferase [Bacteroidaceae bacterium]|nr:glycosyltransferase [Bacteroidaceae bacterium]